MKANRFTVGETYKGDGEVKGIDFKLLHRNNETCLFFRSDGYYEVINVKWQDLTERIINGSHVSFGNCEYYPKGDNWDGKCVKTFERAMEIYENV